MFFRVLNRSWVDTLSFFGWTWRSFIWPILMLIGAGVHYFNSGGTEGPQEELMLWVMYSLAPVGGFAILLFVFNLACAPYRIEKDAHNKTKELIPDDYTEKLAPRRPSEVKVMAGVLERRDSFTLWESASLLADNKITGTMSETGNALLLELRVMMRDGKLVRLDAPSNAEKISNIQRNLGSIIVGDQPVLIPWSSAKISKKQVFDLSVELGLPISGLKP